ncbi:archaea-specific SMC-related protein [Natrialbaceae archaeon GCM10025810]|uniref:archaea-specific SMC-related protein n=1 Tax=Halovalidus salilacus TaxID=3075124 RepID=UPI00361D922A
METETASEDTSAPNGATVRAENIGGIDETEVDLTRGVTVLTGRNATNRTSLLQAIMAALGSDGASLKADAEEGTAVLELGDETYRRTLRRRNGAVVTDGDPYLDDPELADLFAFLLESNEARRAVERGDDLRELIMRPVDTDEIQSEIDRCRRRKEEIDERLAELDDLEASLPALEERRSRLEDETESLEAELEAAESALEETNDERAEGRDEDDEQSELEKRLEELRATRTELERVERRIETERESIAALEDDRESVESTLESLPADDRTERERLEAEIEALQDEREELSDEISQLQSTIQFNERMLRNPSEVLHIAGDGPEADGAGSSGNVTDELLAEPESETGAETVSCWTCGSSVPRDQIEATVEQLRRARSDRLEERSEVSDRLDERRRELEELDQRRKEYQETQRRLAEVEDELERRSDRLEDLREDRERLEGAVDELETAVDELEDETYDEVLDRHREVNELEFELERTREEREEVADRIASIESELGARADLEDEREEVSERLTDLRTRIDRIEADAVESFNEHMANLLEILEYENLDRIWIHRSSAEVREGRRTVTRSQFDLKIVRSTDDGSAYEDSIDHLSESEREVTGLVFALAGYLVHDVYETVPFMLLDSLEAIDSDRIAELVAYFRSYVPYLVVALLHEDAEAVETPHETVTEI